MGRISAHPPPLRGLFDLVGLRMQLTGSISLRGAQYIKHICAQRVHFTGKAGFSRPTPFLFSLPTYERPFQTGPVSE